MKGFLAATMMLTRLPLWKVINLDKKYFSDVLKYWPLVGYITGAVTIGTLWIASQFMPALPACVLAIIARLLLTGAIHEDGLADFFDGFGGGTSREKILSIMKDSHIGGYGTISLVAYFLLYTSFLYVFDIPEGLPIIFAIDIFAKLCAAIMINTLPYVRKEEESKTQVIYQKKDLRSFLVIAILSILPFALIDDPLLLGAIIPPVLAAFFLRQYLKKKIGGYTGDCCGASVLIIEQMCYLGAVIIYCW